MMSGIGAATLSGVSLSEGAHRTASVRQPSPTGSVMPQVVWLYRLGAKLCPHLAEPGGRGRHKNTRRLPATLHGDRQG